MNNGWWEKSKRIPCRYEIVQQNTRECFDMLTFTVKDILFIFRFIWWHDTIIFSSHQKVQPNKTLFVSYLITLTFQCKCINYTYLAVSKFKQREVKSTIKRNKGDFI